MVESNMLKEMLVPQLLMVFGILFVGLFEDFRAELKDFFCLT